MNLKARTYKLKVYPTMRRAISGFGLVELLVALAIVALLWGGFKYLDQYQTQSGEALTGANEAKQQAEQVKKLIEARYASSTLGE